MSRVSHTPHVFHPEISPRTNPARDWALSAGHMDECTARLAMPEDGPEFLHRLAVLNAIELANDDLRSEMEAARRMLLPITPHGCIVAMNLTKSFSDSGGFRVCATAGVMDKRTFHIIASGIATTLTEAAENCLIEFNRLRLDAVA